MSQSTLAVNPNKVRASAACKSCRSKKIRCHPGSVSGPSDDSWTSIGACAECIRAQAGSSCTYPPSKDRAAFSRQYVHNLETRMRALEELCQDMREALGDRLEAVIQRKTVTVDDPTTTKSGDDEREEEDSLNNDGLADNGQWTYDDEGNRRWIGSYNALSVLTSFSPTIPTSIQEDSNTSPEDVSSSSRSNGKVIQAYFEPVAGSGRTFDRLLPNLDQLVFPDEASATAMITAFYSEINPILPVHPEHRFRELYARVMEQRRKGLPLTNRGFISVLFAIFALGERVLITSEAWRRERKRVRIGKEPVVFPGETEAGMRWYETAHVVHLSNLTAVNHLQVQCLTLLAAFQASVNAMPQAWLLAGQALRVAQDLGLHMLVGGLCLLSVSLGRPLGIEDIDIDNPLPLPLDDYALSAIDRGEIDPPSIDEIYEPYGSTMSGFIALTKLCQLAGRVAHLLHRRPAQSTSHRAAVETLDEALDDWLTNHVPEKYKKPSSIRSVQVLAAVLSNTYLTVVITLHRHFVPSSTLPRTIQPTSHSLARCIDAARSVVHVAASQGALVPPSHHLALMCQFLWSSAIILSLCEVQIDRQPVVDAVINQIQSCRTSLKALEVAFPGSRRLVELLDAAQRGRGRPLSTGLVSERGSAQKRKATDLLNDYSERMFKGSRKEVDQNDQRDHGNRSFRAPPTQSFSIWEPRGSGQSSAVASMAVSPMELVNPPSIDKSKFVDRPGTLHTYLTDTGLDSAAFWAALRDDIPVNPEASHSAEMTNTIWPSTSSTVSATSETLHNGGSNRENDTLWGSIDLDTFDWTADPFLPFNA